MIRSDRGSHFANDLIKDFLDLCGTPHNLTLSYSKQMNAIVERVNKEVNKHLRGLVSDKQTLEEYAKSIRLCNASLTVQLIDALKLLQRIYCWEINST